MDLQKKLQLQQVWSREENTGKCIKLKFVSAVAIIHFCLNSEPFFRKYIEKIRAVVTAFYQNTQ